MSDVFLRTYDELCAAHAEGCLLQATVAFAHTTDLRARIAWECDLRRASRLERDFLHQVFDEDPSLADPEIQSLILADCVTPPEGGLPARLTPAALLDLVIDEIAMRKPHLLAAIGCLKTDLSIRFADRMRAAAIKAFGKATAVTDDYAVSQIITVDHVIVLPDGGGKPREYAGLAFQRNKIRIGKPLKPRAVLLEAGSELTLNLLTQPFWAAQMLFICHLVERNPEARESHAFNLNKTVPRDAVTQTILITKEAGFVPVLSTAPAKEAVSV